jgi:hypothetical protein
MSAAPKKLVLGPSALLAKLDHKSYGGGATPARRR